MKKMLVNVILMMLLTACASSGMMHETPAPLSRETSANVTIHRAIPQDLLFDSLIFTIDDVDIYNFGKSENFKFVLGEGNYIFGYKSGLWWSEKKCVVDVEIYAGENYVFNLKPDCVIELF
jgi:hypothetical protein